MNRQSNTTSRPLAWEDEAPAESRLRRMQQGVPFERRPLPDMPLESRQADGGDLLRLGGPHEDLPGQELPHRDRPLGDGRGGDWPGRDESARPWWRPASTVGRVFLGLGVLAVLGGLTTSAFLLKHSLERDARFRIAGSGNIEASGLTEVSRAEMLPVFGEDIGRNIFFVPLAERRKQLEQIPWVERATVMRFLPDQIRVSVVERQPVAFVRQGQQIGLVDASGVLLTMPAAMMAQHHYSFPVVTGIDARDALVSRKARMSVYERLLAELDANGQRLSEQISEIDLTDPEDARVLMPEPGSDILAHFGNEQFLARYQRYKAHIGEWRQQYPKLAAVDLRYDSQVVLEMTPGANVAQTAPAEQSAPKLSEKPGDGKPSAAQPAQKAQAAPDAKPGLSANPGMARTASQGKTVKTAGKRPAKPPAKAKAATAKDKKKRAEAPPRRAAALSVNKQKPTAKPRPATGAGQGQ